MRAMMELFPTDGMPTRAASAMSFISSSIQCSRAGSPFSANARGAAHRGDKVDVAAAAGASRCHDDALAGLREVGDVVGGRLRLGVELADDRAHGDAQHEVGAVATVATRALSVRAALGAEVVLVAVVDERRELRVGLDDDAAAAAAVAH